jgi:hypothetical protein
LFGHVGTSECVWPVVVPDNPYGKPLSEVEIPAPYQRVAGEEKDWFREPVPMEKYLTNNATPFVLINTWRGALIGLGDNPDTADYRRIIVEKKPKKRFLVVEYEIVPGHSNDPMKISERIATSYVKDYSARIEERD